MVYNIFKNLKIRGKSCGNSIPSAALIGSSTFIVIAVSCQAEFVFSTNDNTAGRILNTSLQKLGKRSKLHLQNAETIGWSQISISNSRSELLRKQLALTCTSMQVLLSGLSLFNAKGASQDSSLGSHSNGAMASVSVHTILSTQYDETVIILSCLSNARDSNYTTSSQDNTYCFNTGSSARAVTILRMEGGTSSSLNKIMVFLLVMKKRLENLGVLSIVETKCCPCSGGFMGHCTKYT
ncbi:hypothetical protein GQ457_14G000260 [Hibiscus cannabinus]